MMVRRMVRVVVVAVVVVVVAVLGFDSASGVLGAATPTYTNPVINSNHPDPGVLIENGTIYAVTTSGDNPSAFPIMTSKDMVSWTLAGHVFPRDSSTRPTWAVKDFWAPEIHRVSNTQYNVYFAARHKDGTLSVGVATGPSPLGPFADIGVPLGESAQLHVLKKCN